MAVASAPYLAFLYLTGAWRRPQAAYPYGFEDPEQALFVLAVIGRALNVGFAVGTAALAYAIANRLGGRWAARWSAFLVATAYPVVYYAHTTNLDMSYCFWLMLALYAAIAASETDRPLPWVVLGAAAGMALSTKEQGFAFLIPLPIMVLAVQARRKGSVLACWSRPAWWMLASGAGTLLVTSSALVNPLGFVARVAYLLGHPITVVKARLAPVAFSPWKGTKEWVYLGQLWDGLSSSLGVPLLLVAAVGAVAVWRRPRAGVWLIVPIAALYYLSLRGLDLITLRYLLPVTVIAAILAGGLLGDLWEAARGGALRSVAAVALVAVAALALARGVEIDRLLWTDSRYAAEEWLAAHLPPGGRAEFYQKPAYLPRFFPGTVTEFIPLDRRTRAGLLERRPDVVVISSASRKSITASWAQDWRATGSLLAPSAEAVEFLAAVEAGWLPYRKAAVFGQESPLLRNRITSVAPEITVYVRNQ